MKHKFGLLFAFLAVAGAIFAWGHDGLALAIGLGAGCLLLQLVVAPRLATTGASSLPTPRRSPAWTQRPSAPISVPVN